MQVECYTYKVEIQVVYCLDLILSDHLLYDRPVKGLVRRYFLGLLADQHRGHLAEEGIQLVGVESRLTILDICDFGSEGVQNILEVFCVDPRKCIFDFLLKALEVADEVGILDNVHFDLRRCQFQCAFGTLDTWFINAGSQILRGIRGKRLQGRFDCFVSLANVGVLDAGAIRTCKFHIT